MRVFPLIFVCGLIVFAGCDSVRDVPTNIRERFTGPAFQTRTFPADQRKTYDAARAVITKMDYRFIRGGAAQGKLQGLSRLVSGDSMSNAHQVSLDVKLSPSVDGGTEVSLLFSEITGDDFNKRSNTALGTTTPLHDSPLYEVFYQYLAEALGSQK